MEPREWNWRPGRLQSWININQHRSEASIDLFAFRMIAFVFERIQSFRDKSLFVFWTHSQHSIASAIKSHQRRLSGKLHFCSLFADSSFPEHILPLADIYNRTRCVLQHLTLELPLLILAFLSPRRCVFSLILVEMHRIQCNYYMSSLQKHIQMGHSNRMLRILIWSIVIDDTKPIWTSRPPLRAAAE